MLVETGLHRLKQLGVTDNAVSALLLLLGGVTLLPYVAGQQFGPYSVPELLPPGTFWCLAVLPPIIWPLLVVPLFGRHRVMWRRLAAVALLAEAFVLPIALQVAPVRKVAQFSGMLKPGEVKVFEAVLESSQRVEVVATQVKPVVGLSLEVCGPSDSENCLREQRGEGVPVFRMFSPGRVSVSVFNFRANPPVKVAVELRYVSRGVFQDRTSRPALRR